MENPFSLKVGQVFTGFGVGCGIGIGVGHPLYLGAIPALQPVLSATRGATDALSGVGRHFNNSLRKLGMKSIEAGIGCGVGIGHGFGAGIALKPGVALRIQSSIAESIIKLMMHMGLAPNLSSVQSFIPGSIQSVTSASNLQGFIGGPLDLSSKTTQMQQSTFRHSRSDGSNHGEAATIFFEQSDSVSDTPLRSRTEKVISNFLKSPVFKDEAEAELDEVALNLRKENNLLQVSSRRVLLVLFFAAAAALVPALATDYTAGDSQGWSTGVDYGTWASGKTFNVGDTILFQYSPLHSVNEVKKTDYDSCGSSNAIQSYTDQNTKISLTAPGSRYFVCGTPGHCSGGMKLAISVSGSGGPPTEPTPSGGGSSTSPPSTNNNPPSSPGDKNSAAGGGFRGGDALALGALLALGLGLMG